MLLHQLKSSNETLWTESQSATALGTVSPRSGGRRKEPSTGET